MLNIVGCWQVLLRQLASLIKQGVHRLHMLVSVLQNRLKPIWPALYYQPKVASNQDLLSMTSTSLARGRKLPAEPSLSWLVPSQPMVVMVSKRDHPPPPPQVSS